MDVWPHEVKPMTRGEIMAAVPALPWQAFRRSLKGLSTEEKLDRLDEYRTRVFRDASVPMIKRFHEVCIDNYINALLRGGQLVQRKGLVIVNERKVGGIPYGRAD